MDVFAIAGSPLTASNMYAYCDGNPVMKVDPTGRSTIGTVIKVAMQTYGRIVLGFIAVAGNQLATKGLADMLLGMDVIYLAAIIFAEGGNMCSNNELRAMAHVIINRIHCPTDFPDDVLAVISDPSYGGQFVAYGNDDYNAALNYFTGKGSGTANMRKCLRIAIEVAFFLHSDNTKGSHFFNRTGNNPSPARYKDAFGGKKVGWYHYFFNPK